MKDSPQLECIVYPSFTGSLDILPTNHQLWVNTSIQYSNGISMQHREFQTDLVFIGMTASKQEKSVYVHKNEKESRIVGSINSVFDFYTSAVKQPNKIWISIELEWLSRLLKGPKRMWKRYIYGGTIFGFYVLKEKNNSFLKLARYKLVV